VDCDTGQAPEEAGGSVDAPLGRYAPELVEGGFAIEVADAPLLHGGLTLADLAHVIVLGESGIVPEDAGTRALETGYSQATDLAEFVMRECGVDYRTAYDVVGATVRRAAADGVAGLGITGAMLDAAAVESAARRSDSPDGTSAELA
jgi:hypothetical protein